MSEDPGKDPPAWWVVDRRAQREAERETRRQQRADRQEARHAVRHGAPAREPLTPERIADAALAVVDAGGIDSLTVRVLAQVLGVGTMTLYWYVKDKDEILDLVADRLLAGVTVPPPTNDWRAAVRGTAQAVRAALLQHRGAVPIIVSRGSFGPNALRLLEASIGALRAAGFAPADAADAYFMFSNFVIGYCVSEASGSFASSGPGGDRTTPGQRASQFLALLSPDQFPNVVAAAPRMFGSGRDERFEFGLDCVIDGLASRVLRGAS